MFFAALRAFIIRKIVVDGSIPLIVSVLQNGIAAAHPARNSLSEFSFHDHYLL